METLSDLWMMLLGAEGAETAALEAKLADDATEVGM